MASTKNVVRSSAKAKSVQVTSAKKSSKKMAAKKTPKVTAKGSSYSAMHVKAKTEILKSVLDKKMKQRMFLGTHTKKQNNSTLPSTLKTNVSLALLSPYRFPLDIDRLAVSTARVSGVLFVILGAVFTLLFADSTLRSYAQMAATTYSAPQSLVSDGSSSGGSSNIEVNTQPSADISVSTEGQTKSKVRIKVKVQMATDVTLFAYNKTLGTDQTLGKPQKSSSDSWELTLDTTQYSNGEYKLKALITNQYGSYEAVDDQYITVNNEQTTSQTHAESDTAVAESANSDSNANDTVTSVTQAVLFVNKNESDSDFRFEVDVNDADTVTLFAKEPSGDKRAIGSAYKSNSTTWKYRWSLKDVTAGTYEVTAEVEGDDDLKSNSVFVKVTSKNEAEEDESIIALENKDAVLAPSIDVSVNKSSPLSRIAPIKVEVMDAEAVEIQIIPNNSLQQRFLGNARKADDTVWIYNWDTTGTPNGTYVLVAYVKNAYGTYQKESIAYEVRNEVHVTYTEAQQQTVEKLAAVADNEEPAKTMIVNLPAPNNDVQTTPAGSGSSQNENSTDTAHAVELSSAIGDYKEEIDEELQRLAAALRVKDETAAVAIEERLLRLKDEIIQAHFGDTVESGLLARIDEYVANTIERAKQDVVRMKIVIEERTALEAEKDSDQDGVSDYDEIALYATDPFSADSDGDGFTDGAEILNGYDPMDPVSETLIAYESPKETGIIREDILKVESIAAASPNDDTTESAPAAILSGKALPNSFVTLYVFSTPVVVTVKTDKEGNWNYRFERELEDGEHQVYIGVTDNAGKIVAKSQPFTFVKEAQAFTATNNAVPAPATEASETSLSSQYTIYTVLSISVVAIGLVLILLGLYLDNRRKQLEIMREEIGATI